MTENTDNDQRMSPQEFKDICHQIGLSDNGIARLIGVKNNRTIRYWKAGDNDISGPAVVLLRAIMASAAVRKYLGVTLKKDREQSAA